MAVWNLLLLSMDSLPRLVRVAAFALNTKHFLSQFFSMLCKTLIKERRYPLHTSYVYPIDQLFLLG